VTVPWSTRLFLVIGVVVVAGVLLYYTFLTIDGIALADRDTVGTVVDKRYQAAGQTYSTQIIGNRTVVVPQATAAMYIVRIDVEGVLSEASVDKSLYDAVGPNDRVHVAYQRRRLTGAVQIRSVRP